MGLYNQDNPKRFFIIYQENTVLSKFVSLFYINTSSGNILIFGKKMNGMKKIKRFFKWYLENYSRLCVVTGGYYYNPNH